MALASAFPAGPQARVRPGARSAGEARDQPAARTSSAKPQRSQPIWQEISRAARRNSAGRNEVGRSSRSSAGPRAGAWPGATRLAGQAGDQPDRAHELGRAAKGSADLAGDQLGICGPGRMGPHGDKPHHGQDRTGRRRLGNPGRTKEEAPPRMRWRGPSDPAAPDTAISCSASVPPDQPPSRRPA
jgi:hypothetical protein